MRFTGEAFRAHDPRWSWTPLSGRGAALTGGRFNPKGLATLYLSLSAMTAVREAAAGFAHRLEPLILCSYDVDCDGLVDLRTPEARRAAEVSLETLACPWALDLAEGREPPSHALVRRLWAQDATGVLAPSFARGASPADHNLVLWTWGPDLPHRVQVFDPSGRLPKSQLSWG